MGTVASRAKVETVAGDREVNRRDTRRRAELVRTALQEIVHGPMPTVTREAIERSLEVSPDTATRILDHLVSAGLLIEIRAGVWLRVAR